MALVSYALTKACGSDLRMYNAQSILSYAAVTKVCTMCTEI